MLALAGENIGDRAYRFLDHAQVYFNQTQVSDFNETSDGNKFSTAVGYATRIYNAALKGEISTTRAQELINNFNEKNKNNGVSISRFNSNNGRVTVITNTLSDSRDMETLKKPQD